jgi:hypothetical protein
VTHDASTITTARARFLGRWVGIMFLLTYATSIPALVLFGPAVNDAQYVAGAGADGQILFAGLLEFILIFANIGSAVALYPLMRKRFPVGAIGFVAARITESVFIAIGLLSVLSVVSLREAGLDATAVPAVAASLVAVKQWSFLFGPGLVVPIGNGMLLSWMMLRTGMLPRRLAQLGLVAGPTLLAASLGILFGVLDHNDAAYVIAVVPEFFWELLLGIYLSITGGRVAGLAEPESEPSLGVQGRFQ